MSSLPKQAKELWLRLLEKEGFQKRLEEFRVELAETPDLGYQHQGMINKFAANIASEYGVKDYEEILAHFIQPAVHGRSLEQVDIEGVHPFGSTIYAGFELLHLLEHPETLGVGLEDKLKESVVIVLNNSASKSTLREMYDNPEVWRDIRAMLDNFNDTKPLTKVKINTGRELRDLVQKARDEGYMKADGGIIGRQEDLPKDLEPILSISGYSRRDILQKIRRDKDGDDILST